jgi:hypothetical protein
MSTTPGEPRCGKLSTPADPFSPGVDRSSGQPGPYLSGRRNNPLTEVVLLLALGALSAWLATTKA